VDGPAVPGIYASFSFPLGRSPRTGWHGVEIGLRINVIPSERSKNEPVPFNKERE
jgi:hypothetical protein